MKHYTAAAKFGHTQFNHIHLATHPLEEAFENSKLIQQEIATM